MYLAASARLAAFGGYAAQLGCISGFQSSGFWLPLLGSSDVPPSSRPRVHSVSLRCMLSAWSPVISAKSIAARSPPPCATGLCAGEQVHLADRPVDDERLQRLLRAPRRGGEAGRLLVGELDAGRRLLVGELEVGELAEVGERPAPVGAARLRVGNQRVALAGAVAHDVASVLTEWLESVA